MYVHLKLHVHLDVSFAEINRARFKDKNFQVLSDACASLRWMTIVEGHTFLPLSFCFQKKISLLLSHHLGISLFVQSKDKNSL